MHLQRKSVEKYPQKVEVGQMSDNLTLFCKRFEKSRFFLKNASKTCKCCSCLPFKLRFPSFAYSPLISIWSSSKVHMNPFYFQHFFSGLFENGGIDWIRIVEMKTVHSSPRTRFFHFLLTAGRNINGKLIRTQPEWKPHFTIIFRIQH